MNKDKKTELDRDTIKKVEFLINPKQKDYGVYQLICKWLESIDDHLERIYDHVEDIAGLIGVMASESEDNIETENFKKFLINYAKAKCSGVVDYINSSLSLKEHPKEE